MTSERDSARSWLEEFVGGSAMLEGQLVR